MFQYANIKIYVCKNTRTWQTSVISKQMHDVITEIRFSLKYEFSNRLQSWA